MAQPNISIASLFGVTPEEYKYQRAQNDLDTITTAAPKSGVDQLFMLAGRQAGRDVGGMLGSQDPTLTRITKINEVGKMVQDMGVDPSNPDEVFPAMIKGFQQAGLQQEAMAAFQQYETMRQQRQKLATDRLEAEAKITKLMEDKRTNTGKALDAKTQFAAKRVLGRTITSPDDVTQEEAIALDKAMNQRIPVGDDFAKAGKGLNPPIPEKFYLDEYSDADVARINAAMLENKKGVAKAGANNITQTNYSPDAAEAFAKASGKKIGEDAADIQTNLDALESIREAADLVKQGIFTGAYAEAEKALAKYSRGVIGSLGKVENTEQFKANIANVVLPAMKMLGGNDTKEEREYLENMLAGNVKLEEKAIKNILNSAMGKIERRIERIKAQATSASPNWQPPMEGTVPNEQTKPKPRRKVVQNPDGSLSLSK